MPDDTGEAVLLELKWRMKGSDWDGELGDTVFCQVQHQMYVIGCRSAYVYCGCDTGERSLWLVQWAPGYFAAMWLEWAKLMCERVETSPSHPRAEAGAAAQTRSLLRLYKRRYVDRMARETPQ
jgi:hypothetical protein